MKKEFGPLFWIHILLLLLAYTSPLWVDWRLILVGACILQVQYWVFGGCVLTHAEMGKDKEKVFLWYYLRKIYPKLSPSKTKFAVRIISPILLMAIGFLLQNRLGLEPLLSLL